MTGGLPLLQKQLLEDVFRGTVFQVRHLRFVQIKRNIKGRLLSLFKAELGLKNDQSRHLGIFETSKYRS